MEIFETGQDEEQKLMTPPHTKKVYLGDLVVETESEWCGRGLDIKGLVTETQVNMWGEEVIPSGVRVMWSDGDVSVVYEDEVEVVGESR